MLVIQQSCIQYQHSLIKIVVFQKVNLDSFLKIRSSELNFALLSFVDRLDIFLSLYEIKKKLYNNLGVQGVIAYFYDSSKRSGMFFSCLGFVKTAMGQKKI